MKMYIVLYIVYNINESFVSEYVLIIYKVYMHIFACFADQTG